MEKVIKNGLVFDAIHEEPYTADILVKDGKIAAIGENLDAPGAEVIDASGQHVYPGFVDAHSHLGMIDSGMGFEGSDCNEPTDPLTPQLRGLDGFYAMDPDVHTAAAAGVTTVCTGPGSANVVGGTFMAVKTYGKRVDNMVINPCVAMKCAFGENPKRVYRTANNASRMATASKLRELILKTIEYDRKIKEAGDDPTKLPKFDFKLDAMLPVIRSLAAVQGTDPSTLAWALSMGTDIGGSATPIGASANVVGLSVAAKNGHFIGWGRYCKVSAPATAIVVAVSMLFMFVRYC